MTMNFKQDEEVQVLRQSGCRGESLEEDLQGERQAH